MLRSTKLVAKRQAFQGVMTNATQRSAMIMSQYQSRMFASFAGVEKGTQKLTKALEKEIKYETENYT